MRSFARMAVAVLVAVALGIAGSDAFTAPIRKHPASDVSLVLPARYSYTALVGSNGELLLQGYEASGNTCLVWRVNVATLKISRISMYPCDDPDPPSGENAVVDLGARSRHTPMYVVLDNPRTGWVSTGPTVMNFVEGFDSFPVQILGDGSLWVFIAADTGAEVLRISPTSGRVENRVRVPGLPYRAMLATNADGLWMAVQVNGGSAANPDGSPIYHVASGSNAATIVHRSGRAAFWIAAAGHDVWVDVASQHSDLGQTLWDFEGPRATPRLHENVSDVTWQGVTASPNGDLFAFASGGSAVNGGCNAANLEVFRPGSGSPTTINQLGHRVDVTALAPISCEILTSSSQIVYAAGSVYTLAGAFGSPKSELSRITG